MLHTRIFIVITSGLYFAGGDSNNRNAEFWAKNQAERLHLDPCTIKISITPNNFHVIKGRVWIPNRDPMLDMESIAGIWNRNYDPVVKFGDLPDTEIVIGLRGITHDGFIALQTEVGFRTQGERFEYRLYKDWMQTLGIYIETREDLLNKRRRLEW